MLNPKWRPTTLLTLGGSIGLAAICFYAVAQSPKIARHDTPAPVTQPRVISSTTTAPAAENLAALKEMDATLANLAEFVSPGVVHIRAESKARKSDVFGQQLPAIGGQGSGVIYRPDGYIITNDHVVGGFDKVTVILHDGRELVGRVISAEDIDIAVVKVDATNLPTLPFGDSDQVKPGQMSMAVGSPFGLENSVTVGHISAIGRSNQIHDSRVDRDREYPDLIQTDTAINMGNSGGPLVNVDGQVIGINTAIFSVSNNGGSNGIGFAIPSNTARLIADKLIEGKKVERGAMGVVPKTVKEYELKSLGIEGGARLTEVPNNQPAAMAGLQKDDIVVRIGDQKVMDETDLRNAMLRYSPGQKVEVEVVRDGKHRTFNVSLISLSEMRKKMMPVQPEDAAPEQDGDTRSWNFDSPNMDEFRNKLKDLPWGENETPQSPNEGPRFRLGVRAEDTNMSTRNQFKIPTRVDGAVVIEVTPESPAEQLGLKAGDVIREFNGMKVGSVEELREAVSTLQPGQKAKVTFSRFSGSSEQTEIGEVTFK